MPRQPAQDPDLGANEGDTPPQQSIKTTADRYWLRQRQVPFATRLAKVAPKSV